MRLLVLGGTAEGRALAARLHPEVELVTSLAGRVPDPALPVGSVRIGGFGGAAQMREWIVAQRFDAVVDATHPFAAAITARAFAVCAELGLPHLVLARPAWPSSGALLAASVPDAADIVARRAYSRVFLSTGRSTLPAFAGSHAWFLIRVVTPTDPAFLPLRHELLISRGPYLFDDELALMRAHQVDVLVTKNSGGDMTRAKLDSAQALGIPVIMVERPPLPPSALTVGTVDEVVAWVSAV